MHEDCSAPYLFDCEWSFPNTSWYRKVRTNRVSVASNHFLIILFPQVNSLLVSKRQCIHSSNVCDGYPQCHNGLDEDPGMCNQCPKGVGWPAGKEKEATFSCKHRYNDMFIFFSKSLEGVQATPSKYQSFPGSLAYQFAQFPVTMRMIFARALLMRQTAKWEKLQRSFHIC